MQSQRQMEHHGRSSKFCSQHKCVFKGFWDELYECFVEETFIDMSAIQTTREKFQILYSRSEASSPSLQNNPSEKTRSSSKWSDGKESRERKRMQNTKGNFEPSKEALTQKHRKEKQWGPWAQKKVIKLVLIQTLTSKAWAAGLTQATQAKARVAWLACGRHETRPALTRVTRLRAYERQGPQGDVGRLNQTTWTLDKIRCLTRLAAGWLLLPKTKPCPALPGGSIQATLTDTRPSGSTPATVTVTQDCVRVRGLQSLLWAKFLNNLKAAIP